MKNVKTKKHKKKNCRAKNAFSPSKNATKNKMTR